MIQHELRISLVLSILFFCGGAAAAEDAKTKSFYKGPALFSTRPDETKSLQTIKRFGPVGMGIDLIQPAFEPVARRPRCFRVVAFPGHHARCMGLAAAWEGRRAVRATGSFRMKIHHIEEGSPAAATGKLKKGQFIETINGRKLADIDPRIQLGNIVTEAEAGDGRIKLMVADKKAGEAREVVVKIPVLGAYSKT